MKGKKRVIAALCFLCLGTAIAAAGCGDMPPEIIDEAPVLSVEKGDFETKTYIVGTTVTLPRASALDLEDGDLSSSVKLKIWFGREDKYVAIEDDEVEVKGNTLVQFTPEKCGRYTAVYTVKDSNGNIVREEIPFTVVGDKQEKAHQLLENQEDWSLNANAKFDGEGNIVFDKAKNSSAAYKEKLNNGDVVQFRLNGTPGSATRYFTMGSILSKSSDKDAPAEEESTYLNGFLRILVRKDVVEFWTFRGKGFDINNKQFMYNMLDGKDHTIAFRFKLDEDEADALNNSVTVQIWLDAAPTERPIYTEKMVASEIKEKIGDDNFEKFGAQLFNPETFNGYFNVGASSGDGDFAIKSVGINGEQLVSGPTLQVSFDKEEKHYINQAISFPQVKLAEDGNTYADLTDRVDLKVIRRPLGAWEEAEFPVENFTFTPETPGYYRAVYTVTDYSGNKAFVYHDFTVASSAEVAPPTIVLSSEEREFAVKTGESLTLPTAVSAIDGDELDLVEYVTMSLEGSEAKTLTSNEYTFRTVGTHKVVYTVIDTQGNPVSVSLTVVATCDEGKGMLALDDDFGGTKMEIEYNEEIGHLPEAIKLTDDACGAYKGRKIYEEKVTYLLDVPFATAYNADDGVSFLQFGLRSGASAALSPSDAEWDKFAPWLNGLFCEVNATDGIVVYDNVRGSEVFKYQFEEGTKAVFTGITAFSFKVTDVYDQEDGTLRGINIEMWVNDVPLKLSNNANEYFLPARYLSPCMTQSGWLNFSAHIMNDDAKKAGYTARILGVTIDGTMPKAYEVELPEDLEKTAYAETMYTVPGAQVTLGGETVEDYEIYVTNLLTQDRQKVEAGDTFTLTDDYYSGFNVSYYHGDRLIATYNVEVKVEVEKIVYTFDTGNLVAEVGKQFVVPQVEYYIAGGQKITKTQNITVKVLYDATLERKPVVITDTTFTPFESKSFNVGYYLSDTLIGEVPVYVEGGGDVANLLDGIKASDWANVGSASATSESVSILNSAGIGFAYTQQKFYDEKITLTMDLKLASDWFGKPGASLFGFKLRGDNLQGGSLKDHPEIMNAYGDTQGDGRRTSLWFYASASEAINLAYGYRYNKLATYKAEGWRELFQPGSEISWQVLDVFEDDVATGVQVKVWIKTPDADTPTVIFDTFVSAEGHEGLFDSYYLFAEAYGIDNDTRSTITNIKIERTAPARAKNYEIQLKNPDTVLPKIVHVGDEFTVPEVTIRRRGEEVASSDYEIYMLDGAGAETKLTSNTFTIDNKFADGVMKIAYRCDGYTLLTLSFEEAGEIWRNIEEATKTGFPWASVDADAKVARSGVVQFTDGEISMASGSGVGVVYRDQKFYEEKITMTTHVTFSSGWAQSNGATIFAVNLRGDNKDGDSLATKPIIWYNEEGKHKGLWFYAQTNEGFYLAYGDRNNKIASWGGKTGTSDAGTGKNTGWEIPEGSQISWQVLDLFEADGTTKKGVQVKVWFKTPSDSQERVVFDQEVLADETKNDLFEKYYLCFEVWGGGAPVTKISHIKAVAKQDD